MAQSPGESSCTWVPPGLHVRMAPGFNFAERLLSERHRLPPDVSLAPVQQEARAAVQTKMQEGRYRFEAVPCPGCDGQAFRILSLWDCHGLWYPVSSCRGCGLIQANPRLRPEDYEDFYREHYRALYSCSARPTAEFVREQASRGRTIRSWIEQTCGDLSGLRVVEVGCGAGGVLSAFAEAGCTVAGCDFDREYLAAAERAGIRVVEGGCAALEDLGPADLVILSHVLEHFWDVRTDLRRIAATLAPGGRVYVEVPGIFSLRTWRRGDFRLMAQTAHTLHFCLASLAQVLAGAGLRLLTGDEFVRALFAPDAATAADAALRHLTLLEAQLPPGGNGLASVEPGVDFRREYLRARWESLGLRLGTGARVALYGAGRHTRYLLECVRGAPGPRVAVILDDDPQLAGRRLDDVPIVTDLPRDPGSLQGLVISSDVHERALARRAARRFGPGMPIFCLYENLPPGPYPS